MTQTRVVPTMMVNLVAPVDRVFKVRPCETENGKPGYQVTLQATEGNYPCHPMAL